MRQDEYAVDETPEKARSAPAEAVRAFEALGLSKRVAKSAAEAGYDDPTEIQCLSIPPIKKRADVIACSETGSGKTAAFVMPILDNLDFRRKRVQALALVPTRELCRQVAGSFRELGRDTPLRVTEIIGGVSYHGQRESLAQKPQVVVGTPGRILDLMGGGDLDFSNIKVLILDEADRMMDMGFAPQISEILAKLPEEKQTLMFSATIPKEVSRLAAICMENPETIQAGERDRPPEQLEQHALDIMPAEKPAKLVELVKQEKGRVLIFTETKRKADEVHNSLKKAGVNVCVLHSDRSQTLRRKAIDGFRESKHQVMVATDVASRGLDIEGIELVINYDLPKNADDYIHRIGRTGRADKPGRAISFVTYRDYSLIRIIERVTGHTFKSMAPPKVSLDRRATLKRRTR